LGEGEEELGSGGVGTGKGKGEEASMKEPREEGRGKSAEKKAR